MSRDSTTKRSSFKYYLRTWPSDLKNVFLFGKNAPRRHMRLYVKTSAVKLYMKDWAFRSAHGYTFAQLVNPIDRSDWDSFVGPLSASSNLRVCFRKLEQNLSWEEAGEYDRMMKIISRKGVKDGCDSLSDVEERCRALDHLIAEVRGSKMLKPHSQVASTVREKGGIGVAIDRDGRLVKTGGGLHRFGIAWGLGVEIIPVCLLAVHIDAILSGAWSQVADRSLRLAKRLSLA